MSQGLDRNSWVNPYCLSLKAVTEVEEPWHIREVKHLLPDDRCPQQWMLQLENNNIIKKVDRQHIDCSPVNLYEFRDHAREFIRTRADEMDTLPCGCRAHIPSDIGPDSDIGTCKNCGTTHDKEIYKNAL